MGRFSSQLRQAAKDAKTLASALTQAGSVSGPQGGGGGGTQVVFNTTVNAGPSSGGGGGAGGGGSIAGGSRSRSGGPSAGGGSGGGGGGTIAGSPAQSRRFVYQLVGAIEDMLARGGVQYRTGGKD